MIRDRVDHPATVKELLRSLRLPREDQAGFKRRLRALVASGSLVEIRGHRFGLPDRMNLVVGRVSTNPRGFAFVEPESAGDGPASIFVAGTNLNQAMHGDRVVVRVEHGRDADRAEGRILRILERGVDSASSAATTSTRPDAGFVVPFDRRLLIDMRRSRRGSRAGRVAGEMVTAEITRWPTPTRPALGRIVEVLGPSDAPGVDTTVIVRKYNLPDAHSDEAVAEARRLGHAVRERDLKDRTDFRAVADRHD